MSREYVNIHILEASAISASSRYKLGTSGRQVSYNHRPTENQSCWSICTMLLPCQKANPPFVMAQLEDLVFLNF